MTNIRSTSVVHLERVFFRRSFRFWLCDEALRDYEHLLTISLGHDGGALLHARRSQHSRSGDICCLLWPRLRKL